MSSKDLVRGQRAKLSDLTSETRLKVAIQIDGPDAAQVACVAVLLGENGQAISPSALVFAESPRSDCGGVAFESSSGIEHAFDIDILKLAPAASNVLFAVGLLGSGRGAVGSARSIRQGHWSVEVNGSTVVRFPFTGRDFGDDAAIALGEVYRKSDIWRLRAIGDGFVGGLQAMLSRYNITPSRVSGSSSRTGLAAAPTGFSVPETWSGGRAPVVPRDLTRSVGLVVARTAAGRTHTGTGFVVTPGGHFFTCQHVVENVVHLAICLEGTRLLRQAEVIAQDPEADLALCWMSDRNGSPDWLLTVGQDVAPTLGDDLGLLGFPLGVDLGLSVTYSQGIINSLRKKREVSVFQIDVGAAPGSSGGPVFRRSDGKVVGVLTSGLDMQDRGMLINFAVDIRTIWRLGWLT